MACSRPKVARAAVCMGLKAYITADASVRNNLSFVLTESRAVTGPCTAEYEPLTAGKKKTEAMQKITRIENSKAHWCEIANSPP